MREVMKRESKSDQNLLMEYNERKSIKSKLLSWKSRVKLLGNSGSKKNKYKTQNIFPKI